MSLGILIPEFSKGLLAGKSSFLSLTKAGQPLLALGLYNDCTEIGNLQDPKICPHGFSLLRAITKSEFSTVDYRSAIPAVVLQAFQDLTNNIYQQEVDLES